MAITGLQRNILVLLAAERRRRGESYVAGGVALNALLAMPRKSRDIDLFHDTSEALAATWASDRDLMHANGFGVQVLRETPSFVDAVISRGNDQTAMQWARDSAFRFFPLMADDLMGLVLHPFDLATNKILAMVGRLEVRDWIDVIGCDRRIQPFGYLVWAACGKDPGYNPVSLLASARRLHYSRDEVNTLDFEGNPPDAAALGREWQTVLEEASAICRSLPAERLGTCVITKSGELFRGDRAELETALAGNTLAFHEGRIGGSWPHGIPSALRGHTNLT